MDVGIDSLGVITGIVFVLIVISIYKALKGDKNSYPKETWVTKTLSFLRKNWLQAIRILGELLI